MFHVEHAKTQMRAILIWVFLTFLNFWRGGASSRSTTYLRGPQKRVTNWCKLVIVYILARRRQ